MKSETTHGSPQTTPPTPERIWLLLGEGDGGSHVWCDQPDPDGRGQIEAVEYIRADRVRSVRAKS